MHSTLLVEIDHVLTGLERTQGEIESLQTGKTTALQHLRPGELQSLATREEELSRRLRGVLLQRSQLLQRARSAGVPVSSLTQLAGAIGREDRALLLERIQVAQEQADRIRRQNWTHWIIAHRCYSHYTDILEMIAHGGQAAPTYTRGKPAPVVGGAILDASA
jgi:hypothetical protein